MRIRLAYDIKYECPHPTRMLLLLRVHPSRETDLLRPDEIVTEPGAPSPTSQFVQPPHRAGGSNAAHSGTTITSSPVQDLVVPNAAQMDVRYLPSEPFVYRVGPRLSIVIVLLGAELNAEMEHQTAKDSAEGCPKPLGARGANRRITSVSPSSKIS